MDINAVHFRIEQALHSPDPASALERLAIDFKTEEADRDTMYQVFREAQLNRCSDDLQFGAFHEAISWIERQWSPPPDPFTPIDDDVVLAARCGISHCTTWRVTIRRDGRICREMRQDDDSIRRRCLLLKPSQVEDLLESARRIGFAEFREYYHPESFATTASTIMSLAVRFAKTLKTVAAYDPHDIVRWEPNRDMEGFVELFNRIVELAPGIDR